MSKRKLKVLDHESLAEKKIEIPFSQYVVYIISAISRDVMKNILIILIVLLTSCTQIKTYEKMEIRKMQTNAVFPISKDSLFNIIESIFGMKEKQLSNLDRKVILDLSIDKRFSVYSLSTQGGPYGNGKRTFSQLQNLLSLHISNDKEINIDSIAQFSKDIFLFGDCGSPYINDEILDSVGISYFVGLSQNYLFSESKEAPYYDVIFHLELKSIDENSKHVNIIAINPRIFIGKRPYWGGHTMIPELYWKPFDIPVETSTIEEYEILQKIQEVLKSKKVFPKKENEAPSEVHTIEIRGN